MAEYVADRRETVLDVVVHLACQLADRRAALRFLEATGASAETLGHRPEQPRQRAYFVSARAPEIDIEAIEIDLGGLVR